MIRARLLTSAHAARGSRQSGGEDEQRQRGQRWRTCSSGSPPRRAAPQTRPTVGVRAGPCRRTDGGRWLRLPTPSGEDGRRSHGGIAWRLAGLPDSVGCRAFAARGARRRSRSGSLPRRRLRSCLPERRPRRRRRGEVGHRRNLGGGRARRLHLVCRRRRGRDQRRPGKRHGICCRRRLPASPPGQPWARRRPAGRGPAARSGQRAASARAAARLAAGAPALAPAAMPVPAPGRAPAGALARRPRAPAPARARAPTEASGSGGVGCRGACGSRLVPRRIRKGRDGRLGHGHAPGQQRLRDRRSRSRRRAEPDARCTYGSATSAPPLGPIVPTTDPSSTSAPFATRIEPRWSSVTA